MIKLTIPIEPVAKGRPRAAVIGSSARIYTPTKTRNTEALIRTLAMNATSDKYEAGTPLKVTANFYIEKPKSAKREYPTVKPDLDNYIKLTLDSLNGYLFYDDAQIIELVIGKYYGTPRIDITIEEVNNE